MKCEFNLPGNITIERDIPLVKKSCRLYFNAQHNLLKLSTKERCFFDHLCERMCSDNSIIIDREEKENFIKFLNRITSKKETLSLVSVNRFVSKLANNHLIYKVGTPGSSFYMLNPRYVFKGSEKLRWIAVKGLLQTLIDLKRPLEGLIGIDKTDFLNPLFKQDGKMKK